MENKKVLTEEEKEEQKWLKSIQKQLQKYISSWKWDCIELDDTDYSLINTIMNAKTPKDLPVLLNERLVDYILNKIKNKFSNINVKGL